MTFLWSPVYEYKWHTTFANFRAKSKRKNPLLARKSAIFFAEPTPQTASEQAQIDLIIKRADKVINVCEMKFYDGDYTMKKKDYDDIERRVRAFRSVNNIRQAIHPVLTTTFGLTNNQYSRIFQNVVTLDDLFK